MVHFLEKIDKCNLDCHGSNKLYLTQINAGKYLILPKGNNPVFHFLRIIDLRSSNNATFYKIHFWHASLEPQLVFGKKLQEVIITFAIIKATNNRKKIGMSLAEQQLYMNTLITNHL